MAVSLQKGQKISLSKEAGNHLTKVIMGLGWDSKSANEGGFFKRLLVGGNESIDLDASCVLFAGNRPVDTVFFAHLKSNDGSVIHTGDNLTGEGSGDDEQIIVNLSNVSDDITALVFTVNSFSGQSFNNVQNAYCRLIDASNQKEIARYSLTATGSHTAQIMVKLYKHEGEWKMHAIGESGTGRTINDLIPQIINYL